MPTSNAGGWGWAEPQLRAPLAHERTTPRAAAERSVLVDPSGRPVADVAPDDLALRPSIELLVAVQRGLRAAGLILLKCRARVK